ncbi:MAG TPA: tRNA (guanosine(46)-N7)-methyltransferase TrmB [Steroidobacteraceae bacterium]|jgi:tRNA (guanine-N7-)-methyltransferase|nr:tRNA (guanosine(46)-N7)-methyltransferase TrmB [Steroidobacteraceae bacterium]
MDKSSPAASARTVRSFVTRAGRVTAAQQRALDELWPKFGVAFAATHLDLDALFGRSAARVLEIGFGNGDHLAALAKAHPQCDYLGVEVHRPGVGRLLLAIEEQELTNLRILCHDAVEVLEQQIPLRALDEVLIFFPDPWPKKRHHKRRLIQAPFVALLTERLKRGATLRLATDWQPYAEQMLEVLDAAPQLENLAAPARFMPRPAERARTRFELRGERLGHAVWDLAYRLRSRVAPP